jgi:hypothetical protein
VSFLRYHGAFVSDKLPMIGADSGVEALFESNLSLIKWRNILSHLLRRCSEVMK